MFLIEIPYCDFAKIYNSNQAYRWKKVNDNKYIIIDGKKIVLVEQRKNKKYFICSEDVFFEYWFKYFDCNFDYGKTIFDIKEFYKEIKENSFFFSFIVKENKRYRMVRNDLFETMIYYAIDEAKRNEKFEKFLKVFGEKKVNHLGGLEIKWYKFPNPEKIDLNFDCGLNKEERKRIQQICENVNDDVLEKIKISDEIDAYGILYEINNDDQWIKQIMLYSLGFKNMFCADDGIKKLFKINGIKPQVFKKFDAVKGFLLELMKVK